MTSSNPRWKQRPPGSNWGDFGPDDQHGRLNLITPEKVSQGVAEVHEGVTFCLSLPLDLPGRQRAESAAPPAGAAADVRNGKPNMNYRLVHRSSRCTDVISDDLVVMHLQYSTQWDSFAHVGRVRRRRRRHRPRRSTTTAIAPAPHLIGPSDPAATRVCRSKRGRRRHVARGARWASSGWPSAACRAAR
jgi:hypothetical protein